jgi:hypothetical protein
MTANIATAARAVFLEKMFFFGFPMCCPNLTVTPLSGDLSFAVKKSGVLSRKCLTLLHRNITSRVERAWIEI